MNTELLFRPRSIAIVGASAQRTTRGWRVPYNLVHRGYQGKIFLVNPRYEELHGLKCYPSLSAIGEPIDAVFFIVSADKTLPLVEEAGRCGAKAAYVIAAGFADGGPEEQRREQELAALAGRFDMALCGPNNMGLINKAERIWAWTGFSTSKEKSGPVAVIAQSGSAAIVLAQDEYDLGLAYVVTTGNEPVCTAEDYLAEILRDDRVRVVLMFVEALRRPAQFAEAARAAARRDQSIVVLKTGRTDAGRVAVAAHTGALAGDDRAFDAFFRRLGVYRVDDFDSMTDLSALLALRGPYRGGQVMPVTVSGGEASIIADLADAIDLPIKQLDDALVARLMPNFPEFRRLSSPLDMGGLVWDPQRVLRIITVLAGEPDIGVICCAMDAPASGEGDAHVVTDIAKVCAAMPAAIRDKLVFFNNAGIGGRNPTVVQILAEAGIPYLCGMRPALQAIARWVERPKPRLEPPVVADGDALRRRLDGIEALNDADRFACLRDAGIPMVRCEVVGSANEAAATAERFGFPVALKGTASGIAHKTEHGLVKIGLRDAGQVRAAYAAVAAGLQAHGAPGGQACVVMQPMAQAGVELIIGVRNDPALGTIVIAGLGGTLVEVSDAVSVRLGPVDDEEAMEMLIETRAGRLLRGVRGQPAADSAAACAAIVALSRLGHAAADRFAAIEINPLIVGPAGSGAVGVDLVIEPVARNSTERR